MRCSPIPQSRWWAAPPRHTGPRGDQGAEPRRDHARRRDAEHERHRLPRAGHAAAPDAGGDGLDADRARRRGDAWRRWSWARSTASPSPRRRRLDAFGDLADKVKAAARASVRPPRRPSADRCRGLAGTYTPDDKVDRHRLLDRRRRGAASPCSAAPGQLPADRDHPAHAGRPSRELRRTAGPHLRAAGARGRDGAPLRWARIYLAPGGDQHLEIGGGHGLRCRLTHGGPVNGHCPSVDVPLQVAWRAPSARAASASS